MTIENQLCRQIVLDKKYNSEQYFGFGSRPQRGQFLLTGFQAGNRDDFTYYVGYVVQIRLKAGAFGSDMYMLRHCNDKLMCHEYQSFTALSPEQEKLARTFFTCTPEEEDWEHGFSIKGEDEKIGFTIEEKK